MAFLTKWWRPTASSSGRRCITATSPPRPGERIDRCGMLAGANGAALKRKVGAPVIAVRRAGSNFTYAAINYFFGISQMIIPTSRYWNMTLALNEGDGDEKDAEGIETFRVLGENMAWLLKKLED